MTLQSTMRVSNPIEAEARRCLAEALQTLSWVAALSKSAILEYTGGLEKIGGLAVPRKA